jgi:hypothetical protein
VNKLIELRPLEIRVLLRYYLATLAALPVLWPEAWWDVMFHRACDLADMLPDAPSHADTHADLTA